MSSAAVVVGALRIKTGIDYAVMRERDLHINT